MNKADRKRANAALKALVAKAGGVPNIAQAVGCTKQNVHAALSMGRGLSRRHAEKASAIYDVPVTDLRPNYNSEEKK